MEESFIRVTADSDILSNKKLRISLVLCDMVEAEYIGEDNYKISKEQNNMSERSRQIMGTTGARKSLKQSQEVLLESKIYEKTEDGGMIIHAPKKVFVKIYKSTAQQLVSTFSDQTIKLYIYLYNNYNIWNKGKGIAFLFTKSQLAEEALGLRVNNKLFDRIDDMLISLAQNGLITYYIVRKGKTYYHKLAFVNNRFVVHEKIKENIKEVTKGLNEKISYEKEEKEEDLIGRIGYIPEELPKYNIASVKNREMLEYKPLDELCLEYGKDAEVMGKELIKHDEVNKEYVQYEFKRLGY